MRKRLIIIVVVFSIITAYTYTLASAAPTIPDTADAAVKLCMLGLYNGVGTNADGTPDFALGRTSTRAEALTMFVKLIGKEAEAINGSWPMPFTDVPDWAKPYVGYACANNLTDGIDSSTFGSSSEVMAAEFISLILSALNYEEGTDFEWGKAWALSDSLGITDGRYGTLAGGLLRGDIALVSLAALSAKQKDTNVALYSALIDERAITEAAAKAAGFDIAVVTPSPTQPVMSNQTDAAAFEKEVFDLINIAREKSGLRRLEWSEELAVVARTYCLDMSQRGFFGHHSPEGQTPADRLRSGSISFRYYGETLARGYKTPESVVTAWMNSPGHRSTILSSKATHMGVGVYNYYCTVDFIG